MCEDAKDRAGRSCLHQGGIRDRFPKRREAPSLAGKWSYPRAQARVIILTLHSSVAAMRTRQTKTGIVDACKAQLIPRHTPNDLELVDCASRAAGRR